MVQNECVTAQSLARYVRGELDLEAMEAVESHLLECERCAAEADTLNPNDDVTVNFAASLSTDVEDSVVADAIRHALAAVSNGNFHETVDVAQHDTGDAVTPGKAPEVDFLAPAEQEDELGRLGGYRILEQLGAGGMGIVFRAEDPRLKRAVAIKVMKPDAAARPKAKDRFLREAQAAAAIEHDNVVTILQVGEDRGIPFIAMPLLKGESLRDRLERDGKLNEADVLQIGHQIAEGLAAAHGLGLVHRDIKPDNIWLETHRSRVKLLDFGLARMTNEDQSLTQSGTVLGTPRYMAPEQAGGEVVDHRSDLFSLGSVLYHLASGQPPFDGKNLTATLLAVARAEPTPLAGVSPDTRSDLNDLVGELLAKEPADRVSSAEEVAARLATMRQSAVHESSANADPKSTTSKFTSAVWIGAALLAMLGTVIVIQLRDGSKVIVETENDVVAEIGESRITIETKGGDNARRSASVPVSKSPAKDEDEPRPAPNPTQGIDASAAVRRIAEWENPPGYELEVRFEGDRHGMVMSGDPIPDQPFEIDGIFFSTKEGRAVTDADLDYLVASKLVQLRTFGLKGQVAKPAWIRLLAKHQPNLQGVFFEETVSTEVFRALLQMPERLQNLIIGGEVDEDALKTISEISSLNTLHFDMPREDFTVSEAGMQLLSRLSNLTLLYFYKFEPPELDELQERLPNCRIHFRTTEGDLVVFGEAEGSGD
ncbi:MAG: protein kinase [Planctomycetota bacterium]